MMTTEQIRVAGLDALRTRLGRAGMVRFLQIYSTGQGDYTKERRAWVEKTTLDDLVTMIGKRRARRARARQPHA